MRISSMIVAIIDSTALQRSFAGSALAPLFASSASDELFLIEVFKALSGGS